MITMTDSSATILPFPRIVRVVKPEDSGPVAPDTALVDHDGQIYPLDALLRHIDPGIVQAVLAMAPRSGQEAWDCLVRLHPREAAMAVRRLA
jgi:hypothetical protein